MFAFLLINPLSILSNRYRWLAVIATTIMVTLAWPAYAQGPEVDTVVDENDGSCVDGDCSLRDAITTANSGDTITFANDLSIFLNSELNISKTLTIDGNNHTVTLSGSNAVRVFNIQPSGTITLNHLNVISGNSTIGGGVYNQGGPLTVNKSTFMNNSATVGVGGGIYSEGGPVIANNSSFIGNSAAFNGGGISGSSMAITNSTFISNSAAVYGGGISGGPLMLNSSTIISNTASGGGGIRSNGLLTITNSTISYNQANSGGGIYLGLSDTVTIIRSTVNSNSVDSVGGGISIQQGGTLIINDSTISGNLANSNGGGISNGGLVRINNSTISGNSTDSGGGGIANGTFAGLIINNSTFSNNSANASGGGILNTIASVLIMTNTIIANSLSGGDCMNNGTILANAYNLIEDGSCNEVDSGSPVGFIIGDPLLGSLTDNGGPTWTHVLQSGSPAIDQGDPNFDPNEFTPPMTTDQRGPGYNRIINSRIDIGAYEYEPGSLPSSFNIFLPLIIKTNG